MTVPTTTPTTTTTTTTTTTETPSTSTSETTTSAVVNQNDKIVAPLQDHDITFGELQTAIKVLTAVAALNASSTLNNNNNNKNCNKKHKGEPINEETQTTPTKDNTAVDESHTTLTTTTTPSMTDGLFAYKDPLLRPLRKVLAQCWDLHQATMYEGKDPQIYMEEKRHDKRRRRQKHAETAQQRKYIADTTLRRGRMERLREKQAEAQEEEVAKLHQLSLMIPDGHVDTINETKGNLALLTNHSDTADQSLNEESSSMMMTTTTTTTTTTPIQLPKLRSCYVCKDRFRELHHFYDQMCPKCAQLNWDKRHQTANLNGKVAVVTGSRVKIGYQTCLKLLRAGAIVVATTRFPNAAAATYRQEDDFTTWQDRLIVYGLDLRDVTGIEAFCRFLKQKFGETGIDILINNACQTVRRPTAYYLPACQKEEDLWYDGDATHKFLLRHCVEFERVRRRLVLNHQNHPTTTTQGGFPAITNVGGNANAGTTPMLPRTAGKAKGKVEEEEDGHSSGMITTTSLTSYSKTSANNDNDDDQTPFERTGMSHSAAMSQMILLPEDVGVSDEVLPPGATDINGQQLDLRSTNSWLLKMEQVSTPELMECFFINAMAPFVLNARLQPLMSNIPVDRQDDRYIINVSAMEGKFYRYKMANHPHTNMAKAALNMMTRTASEDLAKQHRIFMNSVDTGWINDENPLDKASNIAQMNHFQTPIDEVDAAARILDPIFTGVRLGSGPPKDYGKFLKDYQETEW